MMHIIRTIGLAAGLMLAATTLPPIKILIALMNPDVIPRIRF
jgi:hypothetical protein